MDAFELSKEQIADYERDGFIIVRNFFSAEEIAPLQQAIIDDPSINDSIYGMVGDTEEPQPICIWQEGGDDIVGMMPRMRRTVDVTQTLLGEECYHWHSKFVVKPPRSKSRVGWHQDYGSWHDDGLMYPNMLTIGVAITQTTKKNGCTRVVPGSHKMGRIDHGTQGARKSFEARLARAQEENGLVYCELEPGDAMIFHCNTLHAADENNTNERRVVMFASYNARSNSPIAGALGANEEGAFMNITEKQRAYNPLQIVPDDSLTAKRYSSAFNDTKFIAPKTDLGENHTKVVEFS